MAAIELQNNSSKAWVEHIKHKALKLAGCFKNHEASAPFGGPVKIMRLPADFFFFNGQYLIRERSGVSKSKTAMKLALSIGGKKAKK